MLKLSRKTALCSTLLLLAFAPLGEANAATQTIIRRPKPIRAISLVGPTKLSEAVPIELSGGIFGEPGGSEAEGDDEKSKGPESERQKKLKKLKFDRRPSAALAAWAHDPSQDEEEAEPEPEEPAAEPEPVDTEVSGLAHDLDLLDVPDELSQEYSTLPSELL